MARKKAKKPPRRLTKAQRTKAAEALAEQQHIASQKLLNESIHITGLARGLMMATTVATHDMAGGRMSRQHVKAARVLAQATRSALHRLESAASIWESVHPEQVPS